MIMQTQKDLFGAGKLGVPWMLLTAILPHLQPSNLCLVVLNLLKLALLEEAGCSLALLTHPLGRQHPDKSMLVNASQNFPRPTGYSPTIYSKKLRLTPISASQRTISVHPEVLITSLGQAGSPVEIHQMAVQMLTKSMLSLIS